MDLNIYDKDDTKLGYVNAKKDGHLSLCYDCKNNFLGKIIGDDKYLFAFDEDDKYLGKWDGTHTYDRHDNLLKKSNLIYNFFYLTIDSIK